MSAGIEHNGAAVAQVQSMLDATGDCLASGAFEEFRRYFVLPYGISSFDGETTATTADDLHALFRRARAHYAAIGLSDLVRHCRLAEHSAPDRITCLYSTQIITWGSVLHCDPYDCMAELERCDGRWRFRRGVYSIDPSDPQAQVLSDPPERNAGDHVACQADPTSPLSSDP